MHGFRSFFTPLTGVLFTFQSPYYTLSVAKEYLALGGGPPRFIRASARLVLLENSARRSSRFAYGAITRSGSTFQKIPLRDDLLTPSGICSPHAALTTPDAQRLQAYMHRV